MSTGHVEHSRLDVIGVVVLVAVIAVLSLLLHSTLHELRMAKAALIVQHSAAQEDHRASQQLQAQNVIQVRTLAILNEDLVVNRRTTAELAQQNAELAARSP